MKTLMALLIVMIFSFNVVAQELPSQLDQMKAVAIEVLYRNAEKNIDAKYKKKEQARIAKGLAKGAKKSAFDADVDAEMLTIDALEDVINAFETEAELKAWWKTQFAGTSSEFALGK